ncbi:MAG: hypothetical protein CL831_00350 [Crocinitomicaceae bacterium]|nr:hypothetical protein [Crocinitomicaceae bacterium]
MMAMMKMPPLGRIGQTMGRMGRMGDNTLVHMNPQEVQGLAALGRLTYNPITGLPEAFNFSEVIEEAVEEKETDRGKQYFVDLVEKIHETFVDPQPTGLAGAMPPNMSMPQQPPIPMPQPPMPQGMAGGGYVGGDGHGMEDNQMFRIHGGGLAALSPKEYVVPADVMSGLGNGNPDDGAEKMDDFISDFRQEKYGRDKQPPEMDGRKQLEKLT